jgi:chorismate synthase
MSNTIGSAFKLTTFGESHGTHIGGVIDGFPAGFFLDLNKVQEKLNLRRPGFSDMASERKEDDDIEFISGIFNKKTLGSPIGFWIKNKDCKNKDYHKIKDLFRPSHADFTYEKKYGIRNPYGGGRSSARETACRVVAGSLALQFLNKKGINIFSYVSSVGDVKLNNKYKDLDFSKIYEHEVYCPDKLCALEMKKRIQSVKERGDTIGGCVSTVVTGVPTGLGEPLYNKLNAALSFALMSINAAKGIEFGSGFSSSEMLGSTHNDLFIKKGNKIVTKTNYSGGIQGGISNGNDVFFRVAFKPVSSIMSPQKTINKDKKEVIFSNTGRHDPCVVSRAVPVVESMTAIVFMDMYLLNLCSK